MTCQSSTCFHLKYSYWVCFLRLWIICKDTKPLCLGALKHGETRSICHKSCIHLSTTMTQVSYTICHSHISADNIHQFNLRKNTVLKLPRNKLLYLYLYLLKPTWFGYLQRQPKILKLSVFFLKSQWCPFWVHMQKSILTECDVSHSKYHNFWTTAPISVKKVAKCSPGCRLQFAPIFII